MSQTAKRLRGSSRNLREGLRVLEWLSRQPNGTGVREAAAALGITSSSAHRFLDALSSGGWVEQSPDTKKYVVGPAIVRAGIAVLERLDLATAARRPLKLLATRTGETAYLGVLAGDQVVYLDIVPGAHAIGLNRRPGSVTAAHVTAVGKVLLSGLPEPALAHVLRARLPRVGPRAHTTLAALRRELAAVKVEGVATNDEESGSDVYGLAVPVYDWRGQIVAGIGLGGPRGRMLPKRAEWTALVRREGAALSSALGYRQTASAPAHDDAARGRGR